MTVATTADMKVVALKIFAKHTKILEALTSAGLYSSKSEVLREACWTLLVQLLSPQEEEQPLKKIKVHPEIEQLFAGPTESISGKFPLKLISLIDSIVAQQLYKNRSDFFRTALNRLLAADNEVFSHFLNSSQNF